MMGKKDGGVKSIERGNKAWNPMRFRSDRSSHYKDWHRKCDLLSLSLSLSPALSQSLSAPALTDIFPSGGDQKTLASSRSRRSYALLVRLLTGVRSKCIMSQG